MPIYRTYYYAMVLWGHLESVPRGPYSVGPHTEVFPRPYGFILKYDYSDSVVTYNNISMLAMKNKLDPKYNPR